MTRGYAGRVGAVARIVAVFALVAAVVSGSPVTPARAAPADSGDVQPIDLAIAVDESGSLAEKDVVQEKAAAAILALGELSPQSRVTVFGFGGRAGSNPAVDAERCVLEPGAQAQDRDAMGKCIAAKINRRTKEEGDSTDFVAALSQGVAAVTAKSTDDRPKLLFLLTDGRLDVRGDDLYGPDEESRQRNAREQLERQVLPSAKEKGVQVWPLGFGDVDRDMLAYFAAQGASARCPDGKAFAPAATIVSNSQSVVTAMQTAFQNGRCLAGDTPPGVTLNGGSEIDIYVTIAAIATDGSINVSKGSAGVRVTYYRPDGKEAPSNGTSDGSTYELAGDRDLVESLRIRNPVPGRWRVHLTAPANMASQLVTASALWQGVLRTVFVIDPPSPAAGEQVSVIMRPHTRTGEITDAAALTGLTFSAHITGQGIDTPIPLTDNGQGDDRRAADAFFTGTVTMPADATGTYTIRGVATGPGVATDQREVSITVAGAAAKVRAKITVDATKVYPGGKVSGAVAVTNDTGGPRQVKLNLVDLNRPAGISLDKTIVELPAGQSSVPFTVGFADDVPEGPAGGVLQLVDNDGTVLANVPLGVSVVEPPTVLEEYWWAFLAVSVVLLLGLLVLGAVLLGRRQRREMKDLRFSLFENDIHLMPVLEPAKGTQFEFDIQVPQDGSPPVPQTVSPGTDRYLARRDGPSGLRVRTPDGHWFPVIPGQRTPLPNLPSLALLVVDRSDAGGASTASTREPDDDLYSGVGHGHNPSTSTYDSDL